MASSEFSHRSSHDARAGRRRLLALTALIAILVLLDALTGGSVRSLARSITASVWEHTAHARSAIADTGFFSSRRALAHENAQLRTDNEMLREKAAAHDVLQAENNQLRAALHLAQNYKGTTAPVVSSFRSSPYGSFVIGIGKNDPIATGDLVVTQGGFVVGVVSDVLAKTSAIAGLFSAGTETDALIGSTAVVVTGDGGGNAHTSVPRDVVIMEGSPVISPAHGGRPVGIVGRVESSPTSPDQKVYIRLPVNLSALQFVLVLHE